MLKSFTELRHPPLPRLALCACLGLVLPAQAAAPVTEKESSGMTARLERLERLLQSQGLVDMLRQVQALQQQVNRLRGEVEVQNHTIEQMRERERALHADMDRRLQSLESGGTGVTEATEAGAGTGDPPLETLSGVPADEETPAGIKAESPLTLETVGLPAAVAGTAAAGTAAGSAAPAVLPDQDAAGPGGASEQADYNRAFWLLKQARHEEAITAFRDYRAAWPNGQFSDNAQYWLGEGYHATKNYAQALIEYQRMIAEFPDSQKITHALLKSGYCLQELGRTDEARTRLTDLVQRYPGTTAARLAEERLRTLAAAAPAP